MVFSILLRRENAQVILDTFVRIVAVILPTGGLIFLTKIWLSGLSIGYEISKVFPNYPKQVDIAKEP